MATDESKSPGPTLESQVEKLERDLQTIEAEYQEGKLYLLLSS